MIKTKWQPPLCGYVLGDTIVLQVADWRQVCKYETIMFYAKAQSRTPYVDNGTMENKFACRQITAGDVLCLREDSSKEDVDSRILEILRKYWGAIVESKILPESQNIFPTKVKCSPQLISNE